MLILLALLLLSGVSAAPQVHVTAAAPVISYVAGSSQKICQLPGETDLEFNRPIASQTETRHGLVRADHGYSFEHDGKLWFLFGDTPPTSTFNGKPNPDKNPSRDNGLDNGAIGYVSNIASIPSPDQARLASFAVVSFAFFSVANRKWMP